MVRHLASFRIPVLCLGLVVACDDSTSSGGGGDGGSTTNDPVLSGTWTGAFVPVATESPFRNPSLDVGGGVAHFLYRTKTLETRYELHGATGGMESVAFPQGTKEVPRVAVLPDGSAVVVLMELLTGTAVAYREQGSMLTALPTPPSGWNTNTDHVMETLGSQAVLAGVTTASPRAARILRLGASSWEELGSFPSSQPTIARVRLASDGSRLVVGTLEGTSTRVVRSYATGSWTELAGLPSPNGAVALLSIVVDGSSTYLLEWQEGAQQSVLHRHDGTSWSEVVRSEAGEAFHGLVRYRGELYTMVSDSPNSGSVPFTHGFARLRSSGVARARPALEGANPFDALDLEASYLVADGDDLWLGFQEGSQATPRIDLLRLRPGP